MNLQDVIHKLPEFDPRPDLWNRIEADLRFEESLEKNLPLLPDYAPAPDVWESIENRLDNPYDEETAVSDTPIRSIGSRRRWIAPFAAAATVAGLAGAWLWLNQLAASETTVTYSEEVVYMPSDEQPVSPPDQTQDLIRQVCEEKVVLCEKPEVKELRNELEDLRTRKAELNDQLAVFGPDPALIEARNRLNDQQNELTRQLTVILSI